MHICEQDSYDFRAKILTDDMWANREVLLPEFPSQRHPPWRKLYCESMCAFELVQRYVPSIETHLIASPYICELCESKRVRMATSPHLWNNISLYNFGLNIEFTNYIWWYWFVCFYLIQKELCGNRWVCGCSTKFSCSAPAKQQTFFALAIPPEHMTPSPTFAAKRLAVAPATPGSRTSGSARSKCKGQGVGRKGKPIRRRKGENYN